MIVTQLFWTVSPIPHCDCCVGLETVAVVEVRLRFLSASTAASNPLAVLLALDFTQT